MAARTVEIVDALVTYLNGLSLSQTYTAEKKLIVTEDLHDLQDLHVYVMPATLASVVSTRNSSEETHTVYVTITRAAENDAALEEMLGFKQEIADALRLQIVTGTTGSYKYLGQENNPQYSNELAMTKALFMSVIQIRYKNLVEGV